MLNRKKIFSLISLCFIATGIFAQQMDISKEEPTDFMHSNGKIFVVLAVAVVIVSGLLIYLISLDKKISKLEERKGE